MIACRPLQPYTWKPIEGGGRRLFSPYLKNGMVVQVAAARSIRTWTLSGARFWRCRWSSRPSRSRGALPLAARQDDGVHLRPDSAGERAALDYAHWPLFGGPFVEAAVDSEQLILKYGKMRRTLDFKTLTVTDVGGAPLRPAR